MIKLTQHTKQKIVDRLRDRVPGASDEVLWRAVESAGDCRWAYRYRHTMDTAAEELNRDNDNGQPSDR